MSWTPRWHHVTQLHPPALSGWNDCWEASLARYLRERNPAVIAGDDWALIAAVGEAARGLPDTPSNPDTDLPEAAASLAHYDLPGQWTNDYHAALAAPWSICLVDGTQLSPAQYPAAWFGTPGQANHFILWLPNVQGAANWFNDPLAYNNGQDDCRYDLGAVQRAFTGAYLLPSTGHGETGPVRYRANRKFELKALANHSSIGLAVIKPGESGVADPFPAPSGWRAFNFVGVHGFAPAQYADAV